MMTNDDEWWRIMPQSDMSLADTALCVVEWWTITKSDMSDSFSPIRNTDQNLTLSIGRNTTPKHCEPPSDKSLLRTRKRQVAIPNLRHQQYLRLQSKESLKESPASFFFFMVFFTYRNKEITDAATLVSNKNQSKNINISIWHIQIRTKLIDFI